MSNVRLPLDIAALEAFGGNHGIERDDVLPKVRYWICGVLVEEFKCYVQIMPLQGDLWVRWSAQIYLEEADFEWAAEVLKGVCERVGKGEWIGKREKARF